MLLFLCYLCHTLLATLSRLTIDRGLVIRPPCSAWQAFLQATPHAESTRTDKASYDC